VKPRKTPVTPLSPLVLALLLTASPLAARAADQPGESDSDEDADAGGEEEAADPALRTHGWIALLSGAGLLAAGAITGAVALHLNAGLKDDCSGGLCPPDRHGDIETRDALAVSSTLLIAAGFSAAMVGILVLAVFAPDAEIEEAPGGGGERALLLPRLLPGPGSIALEVRF